MLNDVWIGVGLCYSKNMVGGLSLVILFCRMNVAFFFQLLGLVYAMQVCTTVETLDGCEVLVAG